MASSVSEAGWPPGATAVLILPIVLLLLWDPVDFLCLLLPLAGEGGFGVTAMERLYMCVYCQYPIIAQAVDACMHLEVQSIYIIYNIYGTVYLHVYRLLYMKNFCINATKLVVMDTVPYIAL